MARVVEGLWSIPGVPPSEAAWQWKHGTRISLAPNHSLLVAVVPGNFDSACQPTSSSGPQLLRIAFI